MLRNPARLITLAACLAGGGLLPAGPAAAAPLPASGTLDLAAQADARIAGEAAGDEAGYAVAPAGDVNGDGRADVLVGARFEDPAGRRDAGTVSVVFGPSSGLPERLGQLGDRGLRIVGASELDLAGTVVSPAGDVDGDGLADVLLGAPGADTAYLVLGRRTGGTLDLAGGPGIVRLRGAAEGDVGTSVGSVPDVDGDGRPEVVVGAPRADVGDRRDAGSAFLLFSGALDGDVDLEQLGEAGVRFDGEADRVRAGLAVTGSPDLNGDGRGEVLIGAPSTRVPTATPTSADRTPGAAFVAFGRVEPGRVDLGALGAGGQRFDGGTDDELLGSVVAAVGDQTGDGRPDVAFGAPGAQARGDREDAGVVHVVAGRPEAGRFVAGDRAGGSFDIFGANVGDRLGTTVAPAGDVDRDGKDDLAVVAPFADALSRTDAGAAYVVLGRERGTDADLASLRDRGFRIAGPAGNGRLTTAAPAGDLDGDGATDLLLGVPGSGVTSEAPATGAAFVVLAPPPPPPPPTPDPGAIAEEAAGCRAVTNLEVLIDDSGSMSGSDPEELRRRAIELILSKPRNEGRLIGAFEFGSSGNPLFAPQVVQPRGPGSNQRALFAALEKIDADNGGTNYNLGFKGAADDNPAAQARVFLTDGEHNEGEYLDLHRGGPPTYVIGLGLVPRGPNGERLRRIAAETGARSYLRVGSDDLVRVINAIDSRLNCDLGIVSDIDTLERDDRVDEQVVDVAPGAQTFDVDVSWDDDSDVVEPEELALLDEDDEVVAKVGPIALERIVSRPGRTFQVNGLTLRGRARGTFFGVRVGGRQASKLRVRYRAARIRGRGGVAVTSQITQSRRTQVVQPVRRG